MAHNADKLSNAFFREKFCIMIQISNSPIDYKSTLILAMPKQHQIISRTNDAQSSDMGQVTELWLSCYLVLLSNDSKTR